MHVSNKIWEFRQENEEFRELVDKIKNKFNVSAITAKVLINRGIINNQNISKFLNPKIEDFYDPFLLKDMDKAVDRIVSALNNHEKIIIFGDYDVDGITSTSILLSFLKNFTDVVDFYIPDRIEEGYGLSRASIEKVIDTKANLIITVDCGITAVEEIEYIKSKGIDVIVTDHHECKDILPIASAIVNPKQHDCTYPFKELAGVGVVFKLLQALARKLNFENIIEKYIETVALGTVADVVPLLDENRIIVKYGLEKIQNTKKVGIKALISIAGLEGKPITATSIGYILAPRINAAGRVGSPSRGVQLFLSETREEADAIAIELDQNNRDRQQTENTILNEALNMFAEQQAVNQNVIVLASEGWHHGVIGIVASRMTEKFNRPTILISLDGDEGKGSGRSISGFNIFEGLMHCSDILQKFGGHELAVGLSIPKDNIDKFRKMINDFAGEVLSKEDFYPRIKLDVEISKKDLTIELLNELKRLEPHGISNPSPTFLYSGLKIVDCKTVGENKHIKIKAEDQNMFIDAIGFNLGDIASKIDIMDKVDVACSLELNIWNGQQKIQLNVKDIRTSHEIIFNEKYYSTLEDSIFCDLDITNIGNDNLNKINIYNGNVMSVIENNQKNLILINTLKGAKSFINMIKKQDLKYKNLITICYNYADSDNTANNIVIINPYFGNIDFTIYDNIILYDLCFSKRQFNYLIKNEKNLSVINNEDLYNYNLEIFDHIIPQRDELIRVYQYIKSRSENGILEGNIFSLTREIAISYNMDINSLKLRKIFEIFSEMNLISMQNEADYYKIWIVKQSNAKVNINSSRGLTRLLKIKEEFNNFVEYLKDKEIC